MPTVLSIDPDEEIRECIRDIFREEAKGFTVLAAADGEEGIRLVKENPVDLVILSLFLHEPMKADEIIREVKQLRPDVKVIVASGLELNKFHPWQEGKAVAERVRKVGYDAYIVKPWEPVGFMRIVRDVLREEKTGKLLVIDDEPDICQCIVDVFKEEEPSFLVFTADNGLDAMELVKQYKPDVILLDLHLQAAMNGAEVLKQLKELHPEGKVAILTGYGGSKQELLRDLGADAYAMKPFTPLEVLRLVKKLYREKEMRC